MQPAVKKRKLIPGVGYADTKIQSSPTEWSTTIKKTDPEELRVSAIWELMARFKLKLDDLT